jgi:5-methyltetrahydropteroyltriglutamate--homocysteine methyltransferase
MQRSEGRILTTHVGALHRPTDLEALQDQEAPDQSTLRARLASAVGEVVQKQVDLGIDVVNDGEFSKPLWAGYEVERLSGFTPAKGAFQVFRDSLDQKRFPGFYRDAAKRGLLFYEDEVFAHARIYDYACTGEIRYTGQAIIQQDIDNLKAALKPYPQREAFLPVVAPGSVESLRPNEHYRSQEDYMFAIAEGLRTEYRAIVDAGFILQVDDAMIPFQYDRLGADSPATFQSWAKLAVDALNHALEAIPEDRVRYHICWGSWNGPHSNDVPLKEIVDLVLEVKAQAYSIEAANPAHEHEWTVWEDAKLPDGKLLLPGVIAHVTNVVEHRELVAQRIVRYARLVGAENVIASTDCGFRRRIHPELAWAKLKALTEGAELASRALWPQRVRA